MKVCKDCLHFGNEFKGFCRLTNTCVGSLYSCDSWKPSLETIKHIRPVFLFNSVTLDLDKVIKAIYDFSNHSVLVIGDIMLDEYIFGSVDRISPEAPIPVLDVKRKTHTLGGAANVVNNLVALGAKVYIAGVMGNDATGECLKSEFKKLDIATNGIFCDPNRPTTKKTRIIALGHQMIRMDYESRNEINRNLEDKIINYFKDVFPVCDIVLISDYAKGVVTNRILNEVITTCKNYKPVLIDPKGKDFKKYKGATGITPNSKEASIASNCEDVDLAGKKLFDELKLSAVFITKGKRGISLFEKEKPPVHIPAMAREVYDVSGAGDTVLSTLGLGIVSGLTYPESVVLANIAAGMVVGKFGTSTISQAELLDNIVGIVPPSKIKKRRELKQVIDYLKTQGKKIVFTNGCFDLLHIGHIHFLKESKKLGDILIVALDSDESVRNIKGNGRPVINQIERAQILSALDCVDYVTIFSSKELNFLLKELRPDILTKGSNYRKEQIIESEIIESFGGKVVLIPITKGVSSSKIIHNIINNYSAYPNTGLHC